MHTSFNRLLNKGFRPLALTGVLLTPLSPLHAFAADASEPDQELAPVVVTATRTPVTANEALASVIVIDRDALEASNGLDLGDILRFHAGIDVVRLGGSGKQSSIFMRGAESNHTLVLVDGVRKNSATAGIASIQDLKPDNIERIEIVKGPRSSLYGSDAIGGVINIITRRSSENATAIRLTTTRDNGAGGEFRQDIHHGGFSASLNASGFYTDGYPLFANSTTPRGYRNNEIGSSAGYEHGNTRVRASYQRNSGRGEYLGFALNPLDYDFLNDTGSLELRQHADGRYTSTLIASISRDENDENQSADFAHTERREIDWKNDITLAGGQLLTVGGTYTDVDMSALVFGSAYGSVQNNHALYLQDQITIGRFSALLAARHENNEQYGEHQTGELAIGLALGATHRVYASVSSGFRAPEGNELYAFGGNPALKPEEALNAEIGSHHTFGDWHMSTAVYRNDVDNLIDYDIVANQNMNIAETRLEGVELSAGVQQAAWQWKNQAAYLRARDRQTGTELSRRPQRSLSSQLSFATEQWRAGGEVVAKSRSDNSAFDAIEIPGHVVLNLHGQINLSHEASLRLRIDNVTDKQYGLAASGANGVYLATPRTATLTLALDF
ncbi:MAG: TonB-dependent receptor [Moraxellaceae bacterium]|nr:TonB-dependent receptor [Moraxellaceae bacterium]